MEEPLLSRVSALEQEGLIVREQLEMKILEVVWLLEMIDSRDRWGYWPPRDSLGILADKAKRQHLRC